MKSRVDFGSKYESLKNAPKLKLFQNELKSFRLFHVKNLVGKFV